MPAESRPLHLALAWRGPRGKAADPLWPPCRQATLEVYVAELVSCSRLAEYTPFLVRVNEKAHQPP